MDIIDTAAEIEELQRNAALSAHASTATPYQLSIARNAAKTSRSRGALPSQTARRVLSAKLKRKSAASTRGIAKLLRFPPMPLQN